MANRQIDPDTYNVGYTDAEQGLPYNPPFTDKADIAQYTAGYRNGSQPADCDPLYGERMDSADLGEC